MKQIILSIFGTAALLAAFAPRALGQTPSDDRVLRYAHTETAQNLNEIATAIRSVVDLRQVSVAAQERLLAIHGTPGQLEMAEWLFARLDQAPAQRAPGEVAEFAPSGGADDVVRVFYLNFPETVQAFQEIATSIRSTAEIRRVFTYNALKAIVMRGSSEQIAMADWLVTQLDRPVPRRAIGPAEYKLRKNADDVVNVYFLAQTPDVASFQEIATSVRAIADIRRVFTNNATKAIVVRGTPDQLALASWLLKELDQPSRSASSMQEYRLPGSADDLVRVVFFPRIATVQSFQEVAQLVRVQTSMRRVFTYNAPRALVLRGTLGQLTQAERLTRELDGAQ